MNKNIIVVTNLGPATLRNIESNGMLLAAEEKGIVGLLFTDAEPGAYVYIDEKNIEEIKKLPRITLKEFSEAKLIAKDGKVYTENKELKINNGLIKIDKISNGSVH